MATMQVNPLELLPHDARSRAERRRQPAWISPMLATLTEKRFSRRGWLFESKLDGVRCLAFGHRDTVRLLLRNQIPLNERYPKIVEVFLRQRAAAFIADGEIVTFEGNITSFAKLQQRMQGAGITIATQRIQIRRMRSRA